MNYRGTAQGWFSAKSIVAYLPWAWATHFNLIIFGKIKSVYVVQLNDDMWHYCLRMYLLKVC